MTKIPRRYSWIWVTDANMCPPEHEAEVIANRRRRLIKAAEYNDTLLTQLGSKHHSSPYAIFCARHQTAVLKPSLCCQPTERPVAV